jgi:hypothetical protein
VGINLKQRHPDCVAQAKGFFQLKMLASSTVFAIFLAQEVKSFEKKTSDACTKSNWWIKSVFRKKQKKPPLFCLKWKMWSNTQSSCIQAV